MTGTFDLDDIVDLVGLSADFYKMTGVPFDADEVAQIIRNQARINRDAGMLIEGGEVYLKTTAKDVRGWLRHYQERPKAKTGKTRGTEVTFVWF